MKKILFFLIIVAASFVFQSTGFQTVANAAWGEDVLVTLETPYTDQLKPSMDEAPNGDLYIAAEYPSLAAIRVYKSMDGGENWGPVITFIDTGNILNPSLIYAYGIEDWVFITYEQVLPDNSRSIRLFRFNPANPDNHDWITIASGIYMPADQHIQPEICTESLYYNYYWMYVTYSIDAIDY